MILSSICRISASSYALSVMETKSDTAGAYTSSIFDTRNMAATPTNCSLDLCKVLSSRAKNLSIVSTVRKRVSCNSLNCIWTSTNQSAQISSCRKWDIQRGSQDAQIPSSPIVSDKHRSHLVGSGTSSEVVRTHRSPLLQLFQISIDLKSVLGA